MEGKHIKTFYKRTFAKLKKIQQKNWIILGVAITALVFVLVFAVMNNSTDEDVLEGAGSNGEDLIRDSLTGNWVSEQNMPRQVYGVMIDNHVLARPQSGVDKAFLVVEAPVEAGISRLLAFFDEGTEVKKIGPVRSARPYYLDWNNELDALYVHVGGSNEALDDIASGGTFDLNQYWNGNLFWRASLRDAPHNVYISSEDLQGYVDERREVKKAPKLLYGIWKFKDPEKGLEKDPKELSIRFFPPTYIVSWKYDDEEGRYARSQRGKLDKTVKGNQILADNIAVAITDVETIDSVGRKKIETIGTGKSYVFQDGVIIEGYWKKKSATERLRFFNEDDEEVVFNSGVTWIEVVPSESSITIK
jgi:hypothetical protein